MREKMANQQIILIAGLVLAIVNGTAHGQSGPQSQPSRIEVGALVSVLGIEDAHGLNDLFPRREFGFGGRVSYNLNSNFALEAEINFFPRDFRKFTTNFTGGRMTEGLFGLKAGIRKNSFGVFGKIRPGFESSGHATFPRFPNGNGPDPQNPFGFEGKRATQFALDVGGVVELYPSRRTIVRVDVGDTIVRYPGILFTNFSNGALITETVYSHTLQFSAGVGFRF
jgi:outer membrane protein with beta-barrel domain